MPPNPYQAHQRPFSPLMVQTTMFPVTCAPTFSTSGFVLFPRHHQQLYSCPPPETVMMPGHAMSGIDSVPIGPTVASTMAPTGYPTAGLPLPNTTNDMTAAMTYSVQPIYSGSIPSDPCYQQQQLQQQQQQVTFQLMQSSLQPHYTMPLPSEQAHVNGNPYINSTKYVNLFWAGGLVDLNMATKNNAESKLKCITN